MPKKLRKTIEKLIGIRLLRHPPRGFDPYHDIKTRLSSTPMTMILDVGANEGQSARKFSSEFPLATIHSFEPVAATFRQLQARATKSVRAHHLALGEAEGIGHIEVVTHSVMAQLGDRGEEVEVTTVDAFCRREAVQRVSFLKIDTEGHDLNVLKGAAEMLQAEAIDVLQVEAGMYPGNDRHTPLETLKGFLEARDYLLFGIYEQRDEWTRGEPQVRRVNAMFISPRTIAENRLPARA